MSSQKPCIVVAGGSRDPNISRFLQGIDREEVDVVEILIGKDSNVSFSWHLETDQLLMDEKEVKPSAVFMRQDVFSYMEESRQAVADRADAWYNTLMGWVLSHPEVKVFNREALGRFNSKPYQLVFAKQLGLNIPRTVISNHVETLTKLNEEKAAIVKPIHGGDYCRDLLPSLQGAMIKDGLTAAPAIAQVKVGPEEVRIFLVGDQVFAFYVLSTSLDYREMQDATLVEVEDSWYTNPQHVDVVEKLKTMSRKMGLTFCAADFKVGKCHTQAVKPHDSSSLPSSSSPLSISSSPSSFSSSLSSSSLIFLEINSSPMFAAYDKVVQGRLCRAMLDWLMS